MILKAGPNLWLLTLAIAVFHFAPWRTVEATCGGGGGGGAGGVRGGGGGPAYSTSWTKSLDEAIQKASEENTAILLYFEPENSKEVHSFFRTKMMQDISQEHSVVKVPYTKDDPLRAEYQQTPDKHIIHVCDRYGNSLKGFMASATQKFPYRAIKDVLTNLERIIDLIVQRFEGKLKNAEKQLERGNAPQALKSMGDLVDFKGHPVAQRAHTVLEKIETIAMQEIEEALRLEDKRARTRKLEKIRTDYQRLKRIEQRCAEEIEAATGMRPTPVLESYERCSTITDAVAGLFGFIDYSKAAPSVAEQVQQAMVDGLQRELKGEYECARDLYLTAAKLDPKDSIALIYLGEVYRHHLGRWADAQKVFERVLQLDNNNLAVAVALHGLGKMMIWEGKNDEGLKLFEESLRRHPTALCYRNLAVFWNTEKDFRKAFDYATKAYELDPKDSYNRVFYAVYLILKGQKGKAEALIQNTLYDTSMAYNYACYYAAQGKHDLVLKYLHQHFYEYERYDDVRRHEMAEARMDINFARYKDDPRFVKLTSLAAK
ncbi:MAG: tetratricopeptide repeat protein [Planctomycetes bacterium]|nr:tetratricopeptide repeat protein [Planctomycetota bacterium]